MLTDSPAAATIATPDLDRARTFYRDTLGLKVDWDEPGGVMMFEAGAGTRVLVYLRPNHQPAEQTVASFQVTDLEAVVKGLEAKGVAFQDYDFPGLKTVDHIAELGNSKTAWFTDPDGNIIAIAQM